MTKKISAINKWRGLFCLLICGSQAAAQNSLAALFLTKTELNPGKYYSKKIKLKSDLRLLRKEIFNLLPDTVAYYAFEIGKPDLDDIAACTSEINKIKQDYVNACKSNRVPYRDDEFAKKWIEGKQGCYIKLKKLYPVVYFEFSNPQKRSITLSSVTVKNFYKVQRLGENDNPYLNKASLGKETIVIDPKLGVQSVTLAKTQDLTDQSTFDLELTFTTPNYRSDDDPVQLLISITFNFQEGDKKFSITSKPFYIDI